MVQTIKLADFRLTYSRQMFVMAYPLETQEMVLDAHDRAFAFFGGVPPCGWSSIMWRDKSARMVAIQTDFRAQGRADGRS